MIWENNIGCYDNLKFELYWFGLEGVVIHLQVNKNYLTQGYISSNFKMGYPENAKKFSTYIEAKDFCEVISKKYIKIMSLM